MGPSRFVPFVAVALLSAWAVWRTQPPTPIEQPPTARVEATARPRPATQLPPAPAATRTLAFLTDTRSGGRIEVDAVRDNRGNVWFARGGSAVWTRTQQGLVLIAVDGRVLERIPGATDVRESLDGSVRALLVNDDWLVATPRGTRRLLGPLAFPSLSPDGRYFAFELLGGRPREIHVLELRSGEEIDVAYGLGRCHCSDRDAYGFPEWLAPAVLTFRDAGDFSAPPEEHEQGVRFEYDLAARLLARVAERAMGTTSARCDRTTTLTSTDGGGLLEYRPACTLPSP